MFLVLLFTFFSRPAFGDDGFIDPQILKLCQKPSVEGRYPGTLEGHGEVTLFVVCTGTDRIEATWLMPGSSQAITLSRVALDGDKLTFTSFSVTYDGASGITSNTSPGIRLEVSLGNLINGVLAGVYKTSHHPFPQRFLGRRDQTFPNFVSNEQSGFNALGTFRVQSSLGRAHLKAPLDLDLDVIDRIERIGVADSSGVYYTLFMGMLWGGDRGVFYASSGVREEDGTILPHIQIRGRMIAKDLFEFYYFNTLYGMSGPYRAQRVVDPNPTLRLQD